MRERLAPGQGAIRARCDCGTRLNMAIFKKPTLKTQGRKKRDIPQGLWQKCPGCTDVVHEIELTENQRVCPRCDYHFPQSAKERIENLLDPGTFVELDGNLKSIDTLRFQGMASYQDRLKKYHEATGLLDAVLSGHGELEGMQVALAVMDFNFLAATMGSVVGERITRLIEFATRERLPLIIVSASGGARMYEGMLSLMQMAKTSGALARHADAQLPYISVLTNPTTAGVMASYASLGDVILAEPRSMIGFAGPRVIKETTHQDLPKGFQTAEFLEQHGLIDQIVHRKQLRGQLAHFLRFFAPAA
jgi:acetyl-CoA carboxylase carboxyl transferase subunit beta